MIDLEKKVTQLFNTPSDINEHIPTIIKYGQECDHITEMGVRWVVSTWVWLACAPKKLISYDLYNPSHWGADITPIEKTAEAYGLDFEFREQDVLKLDMEETDLLFIDTWHAYDQLKKELELHADKVKKYICFHDTTLFEYKDEPLHHENSWGKETSGKGIWPAIEEFLEENKNTWRLKERFTNNNGLTIIERIK
jgi:hypothetical protein|tara:strand:+ start:1616 stop:2200 length:585 start_codon:yes stop_codon:yes gene_type:complete